MLNFLKTQLQILHLLLQFSKLKLDCPLLIDLEKEFERDFPKHRLFLLWTGWLTPQDFKTLPGVVKRLSTTTTNLGGKITILVRN